MIPEQSPLDIYLDAGITALMMYGEQGKKKQSEAIWADSFCQFIENFDKQDMTSCKAGKKLCSSFFKEFLHSFLDHHDALHILPGLNLDVGAFPYSHKAGYPVADNYS